MNSTLLYKNLVAPAPDKSAMRRCCRRMLLNRETMGALLASGFNSGDTINNDHVPGVCKLFLLPGSASDRLAPVSECPGVTLLANCEEISRQA